MKQGTHEVELNPLWLVPAAHVVHCRSDELVPLTVMYDPGSHVVYCLHVVCPGVFCHSPLHGVQKNWFVDDDTLPATHAVHCRSLVAVPLVAITWPALQFCQNPHALRPALAVNVDAPHAAHTVSTIPLQPPVDPDPAAQLLQPAHVRSAVALPRNPK